MPKPSITIVKASEAVPRAAANSDWTVGSATTTDHIPTLPSEPISTATASRIQARRESGMNGFEMGDDREAISTAAQSRWPLPPGQALWRDIGHAEAAQQVGHRRHRRR